MESMLCGVLRGRFRNTPRSLIALQEEMPRFYKRWLLCLCVWRLYRIRPGGCVVGFHIAHAVKTTLWRETAIDLSRRQPYDINNGSITHTNTHTPFNMESINSLLWTANWSHCGDWYILPTVHICVCVYEWNTCCHNSIVLWTTCSLSIIHSNSTVESYGVEFFW